MQQPDFRQLMRETMRRQKVSQTDLALAVGSTQSYISQLLSPKFNKKPSSPLVEAIAKALHANVDEFLMAAGYAPKRVTLSVIDGGLDVPEGVPDPDPWEKDVLEKIGAMDLGSLDPRRGGMLWKMSKARRRRVLRHFEAIWEEEQEFHEGAEES